jgi:hypothetical protein
MSHGGMLHEGGCLCGGVRYAVLGPHFEETNCHCSICRRSAGAPYIAWFSLLERHFRLTAGAPASYRSTAHGVRQFCRECGTQLTFRSDLAPDELDVTIASLDDPEAIWPCANSFCTDRLSWVPLDPSLETFDGEVPLQPAHRTATEG